MLKYIAQRIAGFVLVMIAVSFLTFMLVELLPGDPLKVALGPLYGDEEVRATAAAELGLDRPVLVRYWDWASSFVSGDLGRSYYDGRRISAIMGEHLPTSLHLVAQSMVLALVMAVPVSLLAASRAGGKFDRFATGLASALLSIPNFAMAILLGYVLAVKLQWFDSIYNSQGNFLERCMSMALPSLALALGLAGVYVRVLRTDLVTTLQEDYIVAARATGLPEWEVLLKHALRPSSLTLLTIMGINVGALLGGALIVELIFGVAGLGQLVVQSLLLGDYFVLQTVVVVIAGVFVLAGLLVDICYGLLDPRVRAGG